jgi:hypothetical protein
MDPKFLRLLMVIITPKILYRLQKTSSQNYSYWLFGRQNKIDIFGAFGGRVATFLEY